MAEKGILLVDDDEILLELLGDHLKAAGYQVNTANSGASGLRLALETNQDLVVLDVMMPEMDGWEVCRSLRENSDVPIIMLTAKEQEVDKLRGFRLGVDDYVTKPFSFAELTARIGAVLSRLHRGSPTSNFIESADIKIDLDQHQVLKENKPVDLSPTEYRLLEVLVTHIDKIVSVEQLLHEVWGPEYAGEVEHVKHYIWLLRKKIETDPGDPRHIRTERGFGYRFEQLPPD